MVIQGIVAAKTAGFALTSMTSAIAGLYNMGVGINDYIDDHINKMKASANSTIAQTGCVIDGAKFGFGLGYMTSVVIMAAGQLLLGNTLSAVGTVATAATLSNPIAMTCAAFGAIYYGWNALSATEKEEILEKLTKGLEIGAELIKAIIQFLISKTKEIFSSENISEFKIYIKEYAFKFGKSLYDITGKLTDLVKGAADMAGEMTAKAGGLTVHAIGHTTAAVKDAIAKTGDVAGKATDATSGALMVAYQKSAEAASYAVDTTASAMKEIYQTTGEVTSSAADATSSALKGAFARTGDAASKLNHSTQQVLARQKDSTKGRDS